MFSSSLALITITALVSMVMAVSGLQINIQSIKTAATTTVRDTVQEHVELIVDDVFSEHNEDLLSRLSMIIKNPHDMYNTLKPQADLITSDMNNIQDVCIAQMPGIIANQVHELSSSIYSSIDQVVTQTWQFKDMDLRQSILEAIRSKGYDEFEVVEDLGHSIEMVNMEIADKMALLVHEFNMAGKVKSALISCQSIFALEELDDVSPTMKDKFISSSLPTPTSSDNSNSFLDTYLLQLSTDLQSQLYNQVYSLAKSVYEDLAFSA